MTKRTRGANSKANRITINKFISDERHRTFVLLKDDRVKHLNKND